MARFWIKLWLRKVEQTGYFVLKSKLVKNALEIDTFKPEFLISALLVSIIKWRLLERSWLYSESTHFDGCYLQVIISSAI